MDQFKLLDENKYDIDTGLEDVVRILSSGKVMGNKVYANILASHGRLMAPPFGTMPQLPNNVRLFLIATRGYQHQQGRRDTEEKHAIKYLKVLREGVEEEISGRTHFHDGDGCLTVLGEKTLANMMLVMGEKQTYYEYYGVEFPETPPDKKHWKAFQRKSSTGAWEWSTPFLSLKIYDDTYNEQNFNIDTEDKRKRFGVLFQYRDAEAGEIKNIYLHINIEIGNISLSQIFQKLEPLFTRLKDTRLKFDFTHMTCRPDYSTDPTSLSRIFSNRGSESSSKHCFIRKFNEKYREELRASLITFDTIYEFYNKLKREGKYATFLELLEAKEKAKLVAREGDDDPAEHKLFIFIIDSLRDSQRVLRVSPLEDRSTEELAILFAELQRRVEAAELAEEQTRAELAEEQRRAELAEEQRRAELAEEQRREFINTITTDMFPGIDRNVVGSVLDSSGGDFDVTVQVIKDALQISGGDFDMAVQVIKEHQQARGRQGGGGKKKKRKSKRRKTKRGKINKTKKSKRRYRK